MKERNFLKLSWCIVVLSMVFGSLATAAITPDEFVLYWDFEDGVDDQATDISGREHHGVITAGELTEGKFGEGLQFDGVATFIELAHHDDFDLPDGYTIAMWAMIDDLPMDHIGIPRKEGSYILHPSKAGDGYNFQTYFYTPGATKLVHGDVVDFGDWKFLAATYDGSVARSWIDGEVVVEQDVAGEIATTPNSPLRWANDCCGGRMLNGILDEITIINRAVDETEMKTLMNDGSKVVLSVEAKGKLATQWAYIKSQ